MELIHLLYTEKKILVFDEPTASLSDPQIKEFLSLLDLLKKEGKTIIFITHKLNEVFKSADQIAVMRKGKLVFQDSTNNVTPEKISLQMIGESGDFNFYKRSRKKSQNNKTVYEIRDLSYKFSESKYINNLNFKISEGEILGITGIRENGLELLEDIISGMKHPHKGKLYFNETEVTTYDPSKLREKGISYVPADRLNRGISTDSTIAENLILLNYKRMQKMGILAPGSINKWAQGIQNKYNIEGLPHNQIKQLSGGNIQKVILSRELRENPDLIIICEPSWGLDFRSRNNLHYELDQTAAKGTSILLISSDIDEIITLSDRIAVLYNGEINLYTDNKKVNRTIIGEYMMGIRKNSE